MAYIDKYGVEFSDDMKTLISASELEDSEYTVPDCVEFIEDEAFRGCDYLKSVTISEGVKSIGNEAFRGCDSLESVTIPDSLEDIGEDVFYGCELEHPVYNKRSFLYMSPIIKGAYAIPDGIENVWADFADCEITELTIPQSVQDIQYGAFRNCSDLTVILPERFRDEEEALDLSDCKKVIYY